MTTPESPFPPPGPQGGDLEKYKAELALIQKQIDSDAEAVAAGREADWAGLTAYSNAILEVAKGAVERARAGAEIVQKSAAAIAGAYTTLLGVVFAVTENPFPSRGLAPLILLSLAIVLSTAYLAYISRSREVAGEFKASSLPRRNIMRRVGGFVDWSGAIVRRRSYLLRASVIALALSLPFLASPFINIGRVEVDQPEDVELAPWPSPPTFDDSRLNQVLFTAQVKESADIRAKQIEAATGKTVLRDDSDKLWWSFLVVAVILTFVLPLVIELLRRLAERGQRLIQRPNAPAT